MLKMEDFSNVNIEVLGSEHNYGPMSRLPQVLAYQSIEVGTWLLQRSPFIHRAS